MNENFAEINPVKLLIQNAEQYANKLQPVYLKKPYPLEIKRVVSRLIYIFGYKKSIEILAGIIPECGVRSMHITFPEDNFFVPKGLITGKIKHKKCKLLGLRGFYKPRKEKQQKNEITREKSNDNTTICKELRMKGIENIDSLLENPTVKLSDLWLKRDNNGNPENSNTKNENSAISPCESLNSAIISNNNSTQNNQEAQNNTKNQNLKPKMQYSKEDMILAKELLKKFTAKEVFNKLEGKIKRATLADWKNQIRKEMFGRK